VYPTAGGPSLECSFTRPLRVQTPQSTAHVSVAGPANATVEPSQEARTTTPTRDGVGVVGSQHDDPLALHESAAGWVEREREARARAGGAREREGCPDDPRVYVSPRKAALEAIARKAEEAHAQESTDAEVSASFSPPITRTASVDPAGEDPQKPFRFLSRKAWLAQELASEQLRARVERPRPARVLPLTAAEWGPGRDKIMIERRAKQRPLIESVSKARERHRELANDPATAHFAIAIKRVCNARGWTLADLAARRALTMLEFLRECARPQCWNARHVRRPRRGLATLGTAVTASAATRKYSPCVQAVAQPFLATVLAWPGHSSTDDRSVNRKTIGRVAQLLVAAGVLQCVQVPAHAAEPHEIGETGHAIYRYWLADRGSPKPALMRPFDADGELVGVEILSEPWRGAVATRPPSTAPP
jgi:hypothetical protein